MTQSTQSLRFHIGQSKDASSTHPMRFDLPPNALIRVKLWAIARQQIQTQLSLIALNLLGNFSRFMDGMTIPNQKDDFRTSNHQTVQKPADPFRVQSFLFNNKH